MNQEQELIYLDASARLPFKMKVIEAEDPKGIIRVVNHGQGRSNNWVGIGTLVKNINDQYGYTSYMPILRPIKDIEKEITHYGQSFKMIDLIFPGEDFNPNVFYEIDEEHQLLDIRIIRETPIYTPSYSFNVWDYKNLIEYMFDVNGLIPKGLAIDVNTLDENPYK